MMKSPILYRFIFFVLFTTTLAQLCTPSTLQATGELSAEDKVLIIGGDYNYPPYEFLDENAKPAGLNVEITQAIAELMGIKVEIQLGIWGEMHQALKEGKIHALQGMISSPERTDSFDFSPPHSVIHQSVFARKNSPQINTLQDLSDKNVIVQQNGAMHDYLVKSDLDINLILTQTHAEALVILASGKHDYAVVANLPGLYLGQELKLSNIVRVAEPVAAAPYGYAVKKGDYQLLALFSEGLALLKNTGRYEEIKNKWLSPLEPQPLPWGRIVKYGSMVLVPILLILLGTVAWNWTLRRKVSVATRDLKKEIVERKRAAEESRIQQQQLIQADKMATLGILVSGVAHEINNPTGLILLNIPLLDKIYGVATDSLEARYREDGDFMVGGMKYSLVREEIPRMFDEMHSSANKIKRIVNDLKDYARQEDSNLNEDVDINSIVAASVRLVDITIKKSTTDFQVQYAENIPRVKGNSQRIEQVVVNLLMNGCQALTESTQPIRVRVYLDDTSPKSEVCVEVKDGGCGIAEKNISHVVDPFYTTKRDQGGTGLGLSVSAGIVKDHMGCLEFNSAPGYGTTVTMSLPATDSAL